MYKVYYNQDNISSEITKFLTSVFPNIRKTHLNILPFIIFGMLVSESSSVPDIAKSLKNKFSFVQFDSISKRIRRFFLNSRFDSFHFYSTIINYVIDNYSVKHVDNKVHITFDHMFSHDNYSVFMISMRVGKQGIPLYFKTFKGVFKDAFNTYMILEGISFVSNLFKNKKSNGFRIESINRSSLKSFTTMYTLVCFSILFLTSIGTAYTKNKRQYKSERIRTHSTRDGKK